MKEKTLFLVTSFLVSALDSISYLVILFVVFNKGLYSYHGSFEPRVSNVISGKSLFFYIISTIFGFVLSISNS
ncbi:hypothetical protein [Lusitaniella coriacea]|uniref:hypothetical protein n=1 Tax=Lusitaniella coriacea TaxID=1983105 RepID=UPI003CEBB72A